MRLLKKLIFISTGFVLLNLNAFGQFVPGASGYDEISLLLSNTYDGGSARMQGIGGAQTALGGDISSALSNPAGLGLFNRSEFSITPSFNFIDTQTSYLGGSSTDFDSRLNFANIGVVLNNSKDDIVPGSWRGGSFGISITKVNDFNSLISYQGFNNESSILDYFSQVSFGIPEDQLADGSNLTSLAYFTYLINPDYLFFDEGFDDVYYPINSAEIGDDFDYSFATYPTQAEVIETSGGQYQWSFSYGGNFSDKFYFGLGIGLTTLNYEANKTYQENISEDPEVDYVPGIDMVINERTRLDGIGINGTFGVIARPKDFIRLGASITTPTFFNIDDERTASIDVDYRQPGFSDYYFAELDTVLDETSAESDLIVSQYKLRTPFKASGGVAFFLGKNGFISGDVEYVDYSNNRLTSNDFSTDIDNEVINEAYESVINYKIGGEYRYNIFRFRAGYAHYGDPYRFSTIDRSQTRISVGAGIRLPKFYIDLAVVNTSFNSAYSPYTLDEEVFPNVAAPVAQIDNTITNAVLSAGFFF